MVTKIVSTGPKTWRGGRSDEGHREFFVEHRVEGDIADGPATVMATPGLPLIGSFWNFDNDNDVWALCTPNMTITPELSGGDPNNYWRVLQKFSTQPRKRCQDESIEDPLLEPDRISGSFVKYTEEIQKDRFGRLIRSSSFEVFRGPAMEFDANRPTVQIGQNVPLLELDVFSEQIDTLNDATLWGLGPRKIKLSNVSWERNFYGLCNIYYTRNLEFDIDFKTFDREVLDEGTKVLRGHVVCPSTTGTGEGDDNSVWVLDGNPNPNNPLDFVRYKDCNGENMRTLLNGAGLPLGIDISTGTGTDFLEGVDEPVFVDVIHYQESNFLLLGIPTVLT